MTSLFDPLSIRGITARNRLWVAPMCQYSVDEHDGIPTPWHLVHLGAFSTGGAGVVMAEATAVAPEGRISPRDTGLWTDAQRDAWAPIAAFIRSNGAVPAIQLAHAGRKASTWHPWALEHGTIPEVEGGWQPVAPSALAFEGYAKPRALRHDELPGIVAAFAAAARRALDAGFELLEIHGAHGYLVHQFLSPLSNRRTDEYGGSLENRARLLLEIVRAVRAEVGESVPLLVRLSATDWAGPDWIDPVDHGEAEPAAIQPAQGWDAAQTVIVAGWARDAGADLFDISSGGLVSGVRIPLGPGYQVPFSEQVRDDAGVPVSAVGLITGAKQAEAIVSSGKADAVMMGRQLLRDPHYALHAAAELGVELEYYPVQYLRAKYRLE